MATTTFTLQGTSPTTIGSTDFIQFAKATFGSAIKAGEYQDSTHVESSVGGNSSSGNTPYNTKYVDATHVSINGGASALLTTTTTGNAPLKINFSHGSAVAVTSWLFYAYDGSVTTNAPANCTVKAALAGASTWSQPHGSASAIDLGSSTSAMSHDRYVAVSYSPTTVGAKTLSFSNEVTFQ
jgi:hypothetical protein